ncbi:MAG: hypothetical protein HY897_01260 [Deltaproteobacteria bacterium]|nr:hypothetical protein [Deltaproteobacteria bacterium]
MIVVRTFGFVSGTLVLLGAAAVFGDGCRKPGDLTFSRGACGFGQVEVGSNCVVVTGRPCGQDGYCMGGECITDGDERYCTSVCTADEECPATYLCENAGEKAYCRKDPGALGRCRTDDDCGECASCISGHCRESQVCIVVICDGDADCGSCRRCEGGACVPIADCGPACASSWDCLPDEICTFDYQGTLACLPFIAGGFASPCSLVTGLQCESGICLYGEGVGAVYDTYCSSACADTAHSADCPPGYRCRSYPPFGDGNYYCVRPDKDFPEECSSDYGCSAGLICRFGVSRDQQRVVTYCASGVPNGRGLGRACGEAEPCLTGICPDDGICTKPCGLSDDGYDLGDCPESYSCTPLKTSQFSDPRFEFNGCLHYSYLKAETGDFCPGGGGDCESGLCLTGGGGGPLPRCSIPCTETSPSCPAYFACDDLPDGSKACRFDVYEGACGADADCGERAACASDESSGSRYPACRTIAGDEGKPAEECKDNASLNCTSGLCLSDGVCSAFCRSGDDCPQGFICDYGSINDGQGNLIIVKACIHDPGSMLFCVHDSGCPAADEVCRAFIWGRTGEVRSWCRKARPDWLLDGVPCKENAECASGLCLGNTACTSLCAADNDCGPDEVCASAAYYDTEVNARPAQACRPKPSSEEGFFETGQACLKDADCLSGKCATGLVGLPFCYERCRDNVDCLESFTICRIEPGYGNICTPADYRPVE